MDSIKWGSLTNNLLQHDFPGRMVHPQSSVSMWSTLNEVWTGHPPWHYSSALSSL